MTQPRLPCRWRSPCSVRPGRALSTSRLLEHVDSRALPIKSLQTCAPCSKCNGDLHGTFALDDTHVQGTLETSSSIHLTELRTAAVEVPTSTVQITEPLPLSAVTLVSRLEYR